MGDLRYRTNEQDGDGLWARYVGGKFGSGSFDGNYNLFQLGYDKADNEKALMVLPDRGTGGLATAVAAGGISCCQAVCTVHGMEKGNYTDVVARIVSLVRISNPMENMRIRQIIKLMRTA